jgi:hypothetical protein
MSHVRADRHAGRHQLGDPRFIEFDTEHLARCELVGPDVDRAQVDERPVEVEEDRVLGQRASLRLADDGNSHTVA